ncbi:MAG: ribonuclease III domain-containing protein [Eubacteriales bacterium]
MEKGIDLIEGIRNTFDYEAVDSNTYSPLTLAYVGDCVYELIIRTAIVENGNRATNTLHKITTKYVNAKLQAQLGTVLQEDYTEDELAVYRRGRNAKSHSSAKNASINDYRKATGLEAVMGYLYLTNQQERMLNLVEIGLKKLELDLVIPKEK